MLSWCDHDVICLYTSEQDMERKVQEHKQELERLRQATKLDKGRLTHEAKLKNEAAGVSRVRSYNLLHDL